MRSAQYTAVRTAVLALQLPDVDAQRRGLLADMNCVYSASVSMLEMPCTVGVVMQSTGQIQSCIMLAIMKHLD